MTELSNPHSWQDHLDLWEWRQGEHVTLIGPTGQGKTFLCREILNQRDFVVFVATKPKDTIVEELEGDGYHVSRKWTPQYDRLVLHPVRRRSAEEDQQDSRNEIGRMLDSVYVQGGWTVALDELRYVTGTLNLQKRVETLWLQGRSLGVTVVAGVQRPRHVPLEAYSQAQHLYLWRTRDRKDLARLAEFSGEVNTNQLEAIVQTLPKHATVYAGADGTVRVTGVGMNVQ